MVFGISRVRARFHRGFSAVAPAEVTALSPSINPLSSVDFSFPVFPPSPHTSTRQRRRHELPLAACFSSPTHSASLPLLVSPQPLSSTSPPYQSVFRQSALHHISQAWCVSFEVKSHNRLTGIHNATAPAREIHLHAFTLNPPELPKNAGQPI